MSLIPRLTGSTMEEQGTPLAVPAPRVSQTPAAPIDAAVDRYDGSPPLTAWTWSWAQHGGSLVDLAQALAIAHQITPSAAAHASVAPERTLALING